VKRAFCLRAGIAALVLAAAGGASPVAAQSVVGRLVRPDSSPSVGTLLVLTRTVLADPVARAATGSDGTFALRAPAGEYRLFALRIGMRPVDLGAVVLSPNAFHRIDRVLSDQPVLLERVEARESRRCVVSPSEGLAVAKVYDEIRKALQLSLLDPPAGKPHVSVALISTLRAPDGTLIERPERHTVRGSTRRPFQATSARALSIHGYATSAGSETVYFAPDAAVLLSSEFAAEHCFRVVEGRDADSTSVGVRFEPTAARRGKVDIQGAMWVDRRSFELQRIEFSYTNLRTPLRSMGAGGVIYFTRLPEGLWFEDRWSIRMPRTTIIRNAPSPSGGSLGSQESEVLSAVQEIRGEVLRLERGAETIYIGNSALEDSLTRESEGEGSGARVDDAPVCNAVRSDGEPSAVLYGTTFDRRPDPASGAVVTAAWREQFRLPGGTEVQWVDRTVSSTTGDDGHFTLCGVPRARVLVIHANKAARTTARVSARVPWDSDRVRVDLAFGTPHLTLPARGAKVRVVTESGVPVPYAVVQASGRVANVADSNGVAVLRNYTTTTATLRVRRVGFVPMDTVVVISEASEAVVVLRSLAQQLNPVSVVGTPSSPLARTGYYDRVQRVQRGAFTADILTPEELEARSGMLVSQLLSGRRYVSFAKSVQEPRPRTIALGRGGCPMNVLIDGQRVRVDLTPVERAVPIDEIIGGREVSAVEIYASAANAPSELIPLTGGGSCGIIAIWTARP